MRCRRQLTLTTTAAATAVSLLAAGCGGNSTPSAALTGQTELVAYTHCMRTHGLPGFPDPDTSGTILKSEIRPLVASPAFRPAQTACQHFMPNGGLGAEGPARATRPPLADELSFANCMRSRGVSRFPDPNAQGQLTIEMVQGQGIDIHSPAVLQVVQACLPASHGALTVAKVREALSHAGG